MTYPTLSETILNLVCKHVSEMLDNPDKFGIYPTTKLYSNLPIAIMEAIRESVPEKIGGVETVYVQGHNACREEMLRRLQ